MRFGLGLPCIHPMGTPPWSDDQVVAGVEAVAKRADALGYDLVSCCDHSVIPIERGGEMGARWYDALATLSYVAGMTTRLRVLTSVLILPYRTPFDVAKAYGTLDTLSGGRLILGVGIGHLVREFEAMKANYRERAALTDEYIRILKALWSKDSAGFKGKFWSFDPVMISPRPAQQPHPPIWVGGNSKAAARRAALYGEGWHPFSITPAEYRENAEAAREVIAKTGRTAPLVMNAPVGPVAPAAVHKRALEGALTNAEETCAKIQEFVEAGATNIYVNFRYRELAPLLETMDWFAKEVMPKYPKSPKGPV